MKQGIRFISIGVLVLILTGCGSTPPPYRPVSTGPVDNTPGRGTVYQDPDTPGSVGGVGIESQDIRTMTDKMMRDMLATPSLAGRKVPPRIIIDAAYFANEGSTRINKKIITNKLRIGLQRAAGERMVFVQRHYSGMVESERAMKRGTDSYGNPTVAEVDTGTKPLARQKLGGDYRLGGSIATLDAVNSRTGVTSRSHYITFEMIDLETGQIVWSGEYEFKKEGLDDVVYR
jgi:PBP1b-binding outer membrane lipoprotein LpoB